MATRLVILLLVLRFAQCVLGSYQCSMDSLAVTCSGVTTIDLTDNTTATINKKDISGLTITQGNIPIISSELFRGFTNLQSVTISRSKVTAVASDAFLELSPQLQDLSLSGNSLTEFDSGCFSPINVLKTLDLSSNLLKDLPQFNVSYFQKLQVFNVSHNLLEHLPLEVLERLQKEEDFYVIAGNNPWNCSHPSWSEHLTQIMVDSFCTNNEFDYTPSSLEDVETEGPTVDSTTTVDSSTIVPTFQERNDNATSANATKETCTKETPLNCLKCSSYYCLLWLFGGVWIGIILGNVCKIKNLLCNKTPSYADKYIQCEYSLVEQHMISGVFDTETRKFTPQTVLGTATPNVSDAPEKTDLI